MSGKKEGSDAENVVISKDDFDEITLLLNNIQQKSLKIEEAQTLSYKWNLQHHENLKKVIEALNQITQLLKGNLPPSSLIIIDPEDNIPNNTTSSSPSVVREANAPQSKNLQKSGKDKQSYHDKVMKAYDGKDYLNADIVHLFRNLNDGNFSELKESSAMILLRVAVKWLKDPRTNNQLEKVSTSVAFLWGCKQDMNKMMCKHENSGEIKQAIEALERLDTEGKLTSWLGSESFPLDEEELCQLRLYLEHCLVA